MVNPNKCQARWQELRLKLMDGLDTLGLPPMPEKEEQLLESVFVAGMVAYRFLMLEALSQDDASDDLENMQQLDAQLQEASSSVTSTLFNVPDWRL